MTSINLLKVASLPGSGSGCQSALPAEVHLRRKTETGPGMIDVFGNPVVMTRPPILRSEEGAEMFAPGKFVVMCTLPRLNADLLDAAGGGE